MTTYSVELFAHITGVIGIFTGLGIWLFGAVIMWRATHVEQVRAVAWPVVLSGYIVIGSVLTLGAAGILMAVSTHTWENGWIRIATISFLLIGPIGAFVLDPRVRAIAALARNVDSGPLPPSLAARIHDPVLGVGLHIMLAGLFGIVFLMVSRPSLAVSLIVMLVALAVGTLSGLAVWGTARIRLARVPASVHSR